MNQVQHLVIQIHRLLFRQGTAYLLYNLLLILKVELVASRFICEYPCVRRTGLKFSNYFVRKSWPTCERCRFLGILPNYSQKCYFLDGPCWNSSHQVFLFYCLFPLVIIINWSICTNHLDVSSSPYDIRYSYIILSFSSFQFLQFRASRLFTRIDTPALARCSFGIPQ